MYDKYWFSVRTVFLVGVSLLLSCTGPRGIGEITGPRMVARDWYYRVWQEQLPNVDNLAISADGTLYATLERRKRQGQLVRITDGGLQPLLSGLEHPDGLLAHAGVLYVMEETRWGRLIRYDPVSGKQRVFMYLRNPEGIETLPGGRLVVTEDIVGGRLLQREPSGKWKVLADNLNRPEGLAVDGEGTIYLAETGSGRILAYTNGHLSTLISGLNKPDQLVVDAAGGLWVAEDAQPGRLLRYSNGALATIMEDLMAPQGMVFTPAGSLLLAEQGRNRILELYKRAGL